MDKNPNTEERPICRNCGSTKTDAEINAAGWIACCPERDTRPEQAHAAKDSPTLFGASVAEVKAQGLVHDLLLAVERGQITREQVLSEFSPALQDEGVRAALERARDFITAQSPIAADEAILQALDALSRGEAAEPIPMILHCPKCGLQHIDAPEHALAWTGGAVPEPSHDEVTWENPPHRSHLCHGCGHIWRPADVPTEGVAEIKTRGKNDSPIHHHEAGGAPGRDMTAREAVADAWASIDGKLEKFRAGGPHGHREGYLEEARELIERLEARGFIVSRAPSDQQGREQVIGEPAGCDRYPIREGDQVAIEGESSAYGGTVLAVRDGLAWLNFAGGGYTTIPAASLRHIDPSKARSAAQ